MKYFIRVLDNGMILCKDINYDDVKVLKPDVFIKYLNDLIQNDLEKQKNKGDKDDF